MGHRELIVFEIHDILDENEIKYNFIHNVCILILLLARTFITRALLAAKNFYDAERILRDEGLGIGNGFSVNMLWTEAWGGRQLYNVEVAPDLKSDRSILNVYKYDKEPLVHCNRCVESLTFFLICLFFLYGAP